MVLSLQKRQYTQIIVITTSNQIKFKKEVGRHFIKHTYTCTQLVQEIHTQTCEEMIQMSKHTCNDIKRIHTHTTIQQ